MSFFEQVVKFFQYRLSEPPKVFGIFHICWLIACIAATVLLCLFGKSLKDKSVRKIMLISWIVMVVFELYKQVFYLGLFFREEVLVWDYQWYGFPFQLCSSPLYLLPFVVFMKDGKVRDSIIVFLGTFSVFGGLCNYIYPAQVYILELGMDIQTMVHHGLQIVLGLFLLVYYRKRLSLKTFLLSIIVFLIMCVIAFVLNVIAHAVNPETGMNMFFIGPYNPCTLPILSGIYPTLPYPLFLILFIIGFVVIAFIIYGIFMLCRFIYAKVMHREIFNG